MRSINEPLGKYIRYIDERNTGIVTENLQGISIDKFFMPSVGNVIGTDLSKYKLLRKGRFACNPMHVGRDERLPVSLYDNDEPAIVSPAYFMFEIVENEILDSEYLMLCFRRTDFDHKCWFKTDASVRGGLSWDDLCSITIPIPSISDQRRIVFVNNVICARMNLINDLNQNLLQQALCIYSSLIDGNVKNGCIGDYCSIKSGFAFKSKWWQESGIPVVKIGSISQDNLNLSDCSYVSEDKVELAKDYIVYGGDLLIAMTGATIGKFTMVPKTDRTILVNQRVGKFFLGKDPIQKLPFIYCTLKQPDIYSEVINRGQGSAQPNISASDIMSIPCVIPQSEDIIRFNENASPIFEMIINNQLENSKLAKIRDTLLPQLMSGELDVSEIEL